MKQQDQLERMYNQNVNVAKDSVRMGSMDYNKSVQDLRNEGPRGRNVLQQSMDCDRNDKQQYYKDILSEQVSIVYNQLNRSI